MQTDDKESSVGGTVLTIVVPAYNEENVLPEFHRRLTSALSEEPVKIELIYVNDGSSDGTLNVLEELAEQDERVCIVDLSRNFGKEIALTAGLDHVTGDAVVVIDSDLQDPPELIPQMINEWMNGYDVVYGKRTARKGETGLKKVTAHMFYRFLQKLGDVPIPEDTGDFRLLSRRALEPLLSLRERHRFMKGLFSWIGFKQKPIFYERDSRYAGDTKWGYWKLWNFAIEGITSFTTAPLKVSSYLGLTVALGAFVYGIFIVMRTLIYGSPVPGYPSLLVVILFLGGVQLVSIGILGEYLGRVFNETKNRPLYLVNKYSPSENTRLNNRINSLDP